MLTPDPLFGAMAPALRVHGERLGVLASNIANTDTPGYLARDVDFRQVLNGVATPQVVPQRTHAAHLGVTADRVSTPTQWRVPTQPSADGNTVEGPVEQAAYLDAALRYQAALRFIDGRMSTMRLAIRGN